MEKEPPLLYIYPPANWLRRKNLKQLAQLKRIYRCIELIMKHLLTTLICLCALMAQAQFSTPDAFPGISIASPVEAIAHPNGVTNGFFVLNQQGRIYYIQEGSSTSVDVLDIRSRVFSGGERGLLGLAFEPGYAQGAGPHYAYLHYTRRLGGSSTSNTTESVIARFQMGPTFQSIDPNSEFILMTLTQPFANHNGGRIEFGPDGMLYITFGDGGSAGDPQNNGQNLNTLLGAILRIDVSNPAGATPAQPYIIPNDNPFVGQANVRPEIYAYGLRNVWKFAFDTVTNSLWAADVGQNRAEEINVITTGGNYGWKPKEGYRCYPPSITNCNDPSFIDPVYEYDSRGAGDVSITGGFVYRGQDLPPLQGRYIFGDYNSGRIWALENRAGSRDTAELLINSTIRISSFAQGNDGELYVLNHNAGTIHKLINPTITSNKPAQASPFKIYPNPAHSSLNVVFNAAVANENAALRVYDMVGKLQMDEPVRASVLEQTINIKTLPKGQYIIQLENGQSVASYRFVKQ